MKRARIALVALLLLGGVAGAEAGSIMITGEGGCSPFGEANTAYYGQTFQALPGLADQLTFTLNDTGGESDSTEFHILLAKWEGYGPGEVLFESGDLSLADGAGPTDVTVSLGGLDLIDGDTYVALLDAFVLFDGSEGTASFVCDFSQTYAGGTWVFFNVDGGDRASHFSGGGWNIEAGVDLQMELTFTECGNSAVEVGEQCDDGNTVNGDCCSSTCQYEAPNSPCEDGQFCTVSDKCDATGTCLAGTARDCGDGNGCTADSCNEATNACVNAQTPRDPASCYAAPSTKLQIKDSDTAGRDKLSWSWGKGAAFAQTDLGTPDVAMSTSYTLCVYDQDGATSSLKASIDIAPSATLWISKDPKGLQYKDKLGSSEGVTKAQMKTGDATRTRVKLSAGGTNLVLPAAASSTAFFDQNLSVTVQLVNSAGKCWTSAFVAGDTQTNDPASFKAQTK